MRLQWLRSLLSALFSLSGSGRTGGSSEAGGTPTPSDQDVASLTDPSGAVGAIRLGITDTLDLHAFHPRDARSVVLEFLDAAVREGFLRVRIIHGKGIGVQREIVRSTLSRHPDVASFSDAPDGSGWGATIAVLRSRPDGPGRA